MARRKPVGMDLLQNLVQESSTQEVQRGTPRTTDPKFPVFSTPVGQDILVYFPKTNMITTENGEEMQLLRSYMHQGQVGNQYVNFRCIQSLSGGAFEQLGYDGTCPACEAMQEVWELYNLKYESEARKRGIDPQDDKDEVLKPIRQRLLNEMDLRGNEEFVTFPIVYLPTSAMRQAQGGGVSLIEDWEDKLQAAFVHWRRKRYNDKIGGALSSLLVNPGHPAGLFWYWKFTYDTGNKQPNARDAALNAQFSIIQDQNFKQALEPIIPVAEEKAKEFTIIKAAEVVVANQFMYKEDLDKEVDRIMKKTRELLVIAQTKGAEALNPGGSGNAPALGAGNPLAQFGVASQGEAPQNLGQEQAAPQPNQQTATQAAPQTATQAAPQTATQAAPQTATQAAPQHDQQSGQQTAPVFGQPTNPVQM